MSIEPRSGTWKGPLVVLVIVLVLGLGSTLFLGSQVSGILSTVGASVGSNPGPGGEGGGQDGGGGDGDAGAGQDEGDDGETGSPGDGTGSGGVLLLGVARPELLLIKTGEITLQVGDIDAALDVATQAIDRLGGYASGSRRTGTNDEATAAVTFRIPVAAWDAAQTDLRGLGGTVLDGHSETEDATGDVVDVEARIRNLRVTEAALQSIMTQASAINDVLRVQAELTTVRGEIEQLQSRASHLRQQAAMSTLTLHLRRTPAPAVAVQEARFDPGAEADAATAHLVSVGQVLVKVGIWLGIAWLPILAAVALVGGIGFLLYRRLRRSGGEPPVAAGIHGG